MNMTKNCKVSRWMTKRVSAKKMKKKKKRDHLHVWCRTCERDPE
jgi:hypothetical protein